MSHRKSTCLRCGKFAPLIHDCVESERKKIAWQVGVVLRLVLLCVFLLIVLVIIGVLYTT